MSTHARHFIGTLPGWFSTILLGLVGFFAVNLLHEIRSDIRDLKIQMVEQKEQTAVLRTEQANIRRDVDELRRRP